MRQFYPPSFKSSRDFKTQKRLHMKNVLKAIYELRLGCAYMPCYQEIKIAMNNLEKARKAISVKRWGR